MAKKQYFDWQIRCEHPLAGQKKHHIILEVCTVGIHSRFQNIVIIQLQDFLGSDNRMACHDIKVQSFYTYWTFYSRSRMLFVFKTI